jgi:hypothetical protein
MVKEKQQDYTVEREGSLEYVVVRCPNGHRLRGMKVSDMMVRQRLACPECGALWTVLAPATNGMEVCV